MGSSSFAQPPSFSRLRSLILRRYAQFALLIGGIIVARFCIAVPLSASAFDVYLLLLAVGLACMGASRWIQTLDELRAVPSGTAPGLSSKQGVALVALPPAFPFAKASRLPLVARLLGARLEFAPGAIAIKWRFGERRIAHREIARADWQHDGVLVWLRDGRSLLIPTCRLPSFSGPSGHYPELGQAVQSVTFAVLRHNQDIAERIRWECERVGGPSYRRAPRPRD
jgi:hypothetical protein